MKAQLLGIITGVNDLHTLFWMCSDPQGRTEVYDLVRRWGAKSSA